MQPQSQRKAQRRGVWAESMVWLRYDHKAISKYDEICRNLDPRKLQSRYNTTFNFLQEFFYFMSGLLLGGVSIYKWFNVTGVSIGDSIYLGGNGSKLRSSSSTPTIGVLSIARTSPPKFVVFPQFLTSEISKQVAGGGFFTETLVLMSQTTMNNQDIGVERGGFCWFDGRASPTSQTNYSQKE